MNTFLSVVEYLLALLFIFGGILIGIEDATVGTGPLAEIVGGNTAIFLWGASFTATGFNLIYAKATKQKKIHLHTLMAAYLITIAETVAEGLIVGVGVGLIDNVIIILIAAALWLKRKSDFLYIPTNGEKIKPLV